MFSQLRKQLKLGSLTLAMAALVGLSLSSGCKSTDPDPSLIPEDQAPSITLAPGNNPQILRRAGESFSITFKLADNERLALFRIVGRIIDAQGSVTGQDFIILDSTITGQQVTMTYNALAPGLPELYKVEHTVYAIDSKGASTASVFTLSIDRNPNIPPSNEVLSYTGKQIFTRKASEKYAYNFSNVRALPQGGAGNPLDFDIEESSGSGLVFWNPKLISTNNNMEGQDSVFVMTDGSRFNFEEASWETMSNAFYADPAPLLETPVLKIGDYVIVRLTKAPRPQFAILKVMELNDDGGGQTGDNMVFDYKVTNAK